MSSGSDKRQRPHQSLVRWTSEEFARAAAKADKAGLALAAFIRAAILGDAGPRAQRRPTVNKELMIRVRGRGLWAFRSASGGGGAGEVRVVLRRNATRRESASTV